MLDPIRCAWRVVRRQQPPSMLSPSSPSPWPPPSPCGQRRRSFHPQLGRATPPPPLLLVLPQCRRLPDLSRYRRQPLTLPPQCHPLLDRCRCRRSLCYRTVLCPLPRHTPLPRFPRYPSLQPRRCRLAAVPPPFNLMSRGRRLFHYCRSFYPQCRSWEPCRQRRLHRLPH